jgi:hypothetical protein
MVVDERLLVDAPLILAQELGTRVAEQVVHEGERLNGAAEVTGREGLRRLAVVDREELHRLYDAARELEELRLSRGIHSVTIQGCTFPNDYARRNDTAEAALHPRVEQGIADSAAGVKGVWNDSGSGGVHPGALGDDPTPTEPAAMAGHRTSLCKYHGSPEPAGCFEVAPMRGTRWDPKAVDRPLEEAKANARRAVQRATPSWPVCTNGGTVELTFLELGNGSAPGRVRYGAFWKCSCK